jgi:hypothetical protein
MTDTGYEAVQELLFIPTAMFSEALQVFDIVNLAKPSRLGGLKILRWTRDELYAYTEMSANRSCS